MGELGSAYQKVLALGEFVGQGACWDAVVKHWQFLHSHAVIAQERSPRPNGSSCAMHVRRHGIYAEARIGWRIVMASDECTSLFKSLCTCTFLYVHSCWSMYIACTTAVVVSLLYALLTKHSCMGA